MRAHGARNSNQQFCSTTPPALAKNFCDTTRDMLVVANFLAGISGAPTVTEHKHIICRYTVAFSVE